MCVGVTVWFGWGGVVSLCRLLKMNVLAFEACRAKNKASDISWSIFIQILCILTINLRGLVVLPGVYLIASRKLLKMNVLAFETC